MNPATDPIARSYDVVVVGARCAGAATAMLLARAGLSVLAVERSSIGADTLSTHALTRPGVLQLSRWGVLDAVREAGTPRVNTVAQHYGDEAVEIPIKPKGDVDGLYAPRRTVIDRILVDAARAGGATVLHGRPVTDLVVDAAGRVQGVVIGRGGSGVRVRCRFVIGADGARSFVARRVGSQVEHSYATSSAAAYAYLPGLPDDTYRNYFVPGSAVAVVPTNDGLANVSVSVSMDRFATRARRDVVAFYLDALGSVVPGLAAQARRSTGLSVRRFAGLRGFARRPWGPGWALVGDAAYFKDPLSAHGMTDAVIGAELVARAVVESFVGTDEAVAMANYAATRAWLAEPMMPAIERLAAFRWQPWEVRKDHLELNQAMRDEWRHLESLPALPALPSTTVREAVS